MWCDDYANESKARPLESEQSAEQSAATSPGGAVDEERVANDGRARPEVLPDV